MAASEPVKVLLIEDNLDEAELVGVMLGAILKSKFEITHRGLLKEGIAYLETHRSQKDRVDIVLLDLHLPDSKGYETFERLSARIPWVPVILLSNLKDEDLALKSVCHGAQDYLLKTELEPNLLWRAIRYAIGRKQVEEALRESEERYMLAIQGANDGVWDWDLRADQVYFSPRWKEILHYHPSDIGEQIDEWLSRIHPEDSENVRTALDDHLSGSSEHFECEHRLRHKDGEYTWVLMRGLAVRDPQGEAYRMAGSLTDISIHKETEEKLLHDALHDALTGLPNRTLFMDRLEHIIERSKRHQGRGYSVLFFDLDRFKLINDGLGHTYGDQLLQKVAEALKSCLRTSDSAARLGGDEFAVLLEGINDVSESILISERIQEALQAPIALNGHNVVISASIGIILGDARYKIPEEILRDADIAMYDAKLQGKACYAIFDPSMHTRAIMRMELENELREALSTEESRCRNLRVLFQPIVAVSDEQILGFEALVRWDHPERGMIFPNEFIPMAEETGLIHPLGLWVLQVACKQVRIWQGYLSGEQKGSPISVNVNISGKQFSRPDFVEKIEEVLQESGVEPAALNLEITERLLVENDPTIVQALERLRRIGVKLQIDDFGRGYSSFGYLQQLPVNTLKIDSLFVQKIEINGGNTEIIRSIVGLARSLGLSVIAEGVETVRQYQKLKQLNCQFVQGFYISRAVSGQEAGELILLNRQGGHSPKY